jgi:hypothetical protein
MGELSSNDITNPFKTSGMSMPFLNGERKPCPQPEVGAGAGDECSISGHGGA